MKLKYITWLPVVFLMITIFLFSSKPAETSGESSLIISRTVLQLYENVANVNYNATDRVQILSDVDHIVRKTAHFIEYAILAAALVLFFTSWDVINRKSFWLSVLITAVYAMSDEYHQTFVAGRSGQASDVLLDTCGGITGALFFLLFFTVAKRIKERRRQMN